MKITALIANWRGQARIRREHYPHDESMTIRAEMYDRCADSLEAISGITVVWRIAPKLDPTQYTLHPTWEVAEASCGTQYRHLYGDPAPEERDDVLFVVQTEDGMNSLHRTYAGAQEACEEQNYIEVVEVEE